MQSDIDRIKEAPQGVMCIRDGKQVGDHIGDDFLRAGRILTKVGDLLRLETPHSVILELIDHMRSGPTNNIIKIDVSDDD